MTIGRVLGLHKSLVPSGNSMLDSLACRSLSTRPRFSMKRKLHVSSFDSPAPEELRITVTRLLSSSARVARPDPESSDLPGAATVILTRTFARGLGLEGKIRSVSP